ncbi:MAG: NAD-dependent epimerase/dehydratase family protein [Hyphomicrobiales bacterium]
MSSAESILVFGGDGFCGWPTALHLSNLGYDVSIVDNLSRREIDEELATNSLTPIADMATRIKAWREISGNSIAFYNIDLAHEHVALTELLRSLKPASIVHFAEQRAAPYSMKGPRQKRYTVDNNLQATHNLLVAAVETGTDPHIIHLGTMGVYGYDTPGATLPEGYLNVGIRMEDGSSEEREILYPTNPGSVYHLTKSLDQLLFQFYAKNDKLRITDLHQGIVWGTQTEETRLDERLINRFDYDGDYGTVLNRFLVQAAIGYPLSVYGSGGQTRAFIHIQDTVRCIALAIGDPPTAGNRVSIRNQISECHRVRDLADIVAGITGAQIASVRNPRIEQEENELSASNNSFLELGLSPILLKDGLLQETMEICDIYRDRCDLSVIPSTSEWVAQRGDTLSETPQSATELSESRNI